MTAKPNVGDTRIDALSGETWVYEAFPNYAEHKAWAERFNHPVGPEGYWVPIPVVTSPWSPDPDITEEELALIKSTTPIESPESIAAAVAAVPKFDEGGHRLDANGNRLLSVKVA